MANQGIPLDIEIIFKEVLVNEWHKVWMKLRNGMGWNDKEKTIFRASMIKMKEKVEISGEIKGKTDVMDVTAGENSSRLYSASVVNEGNFFFFVLYKVRLLRTSTSEGKLTGRGTIAIRRTVKCVLLRVAVCCC